MNLAIVLTGSLLLAVLAVLIGNGVDTHARDAAWRRIASARREHQQQLHAMRRCLDSPRCDYCPVNRYFGRR